MPAESSQQSPPRLVRRFAVYAGVALVIAAVGSYFFVRHYSTTRAERSVTSRARFITQAILSHRLVPSDFADPVVGERRQALDRLSHELLTGSSLRVKLYGTGDRVTYSNDHFLIGSVPPDTEEVDAARNGATVTDVTTLNSEGGTGPDAKVLESYVPVDLGGARPAGVFELYSDYGPIASDARGIFLPVAGGVALLLLGLYASFFPILRRVTRTLRGQVDEIGHKAYHDALTDLPNRTLFMERVKEALSGSGADGSRFAVMLIDLDRFKEINESLGHESGDRLLEMIASELPPLVEPGGTVARLGGDEFGVLALDVANAAAALALAREIRSVIARPHLVGHLELEVDASIGIALHPDHGADAEALLRHADVAMYRAKEIEVPAVYEAEHDHHSPARLALISGMRRAIERGELILHYQPQRRLDDDSLRGVEALVRWQHPEHGLLFPDEFIPFAEHTGVIRRLTRYVLDTALAQSRAWEDDHLSLRVSVNVTGRDLHDPRFPDEVRSALERWRIPAGRLELEITEGTVLTDPARVRGVLEDLHELGVSLAIDDFGRGQSSLGYLQRLPVNVLKVDKSFVVHMLENEDDAVIVRSTLDLGHNLGLEVIAEGVERENIWLRLKELGCDVAQGYYVGRPALEPKAVVAGLRPRAPAS